MTTVQRTAQIFGWGFVIIAILGFFSSEGSMIAEPELAPEVLGIFPVNLLHNVVHLAFGIWGIVAARSFGASKAYCQISGIAYLGLVVLAFFFPSLFGLMPIGGADILLHAFIGIVLTAVGFTARAEHDVRYTAPPPAA